VVVRSPDPGTVGGTAKRSGPPVGCRDHLEPRTKPREGSLA
jgi:hypothetical protein